MSDKELPRFEHCLWGVKEGNEDWQEELLSTNPEAFERVKLLAAKDGYGRFREANRSKESGCRF
jgi:hypothetical protein